MKIIYYWVIGSSKYNSRKYYPVNQLYKQQFGGCSCEALEGCDVVSIETNMQVHNRITRILFWRLLFFYLVLCHFVGQNYCPPKEQVRKCLHEIIDRI